MGRGRRGRSGFGAAGDPLKQRGPLRPLRLRGGRAPRGAGRSRRRQRTRRQLPSPPPLASPPRLLSGKEGNLRAKGDGVVGSPLLLLRRAGQEAPSLRGTDAPRAQGFSDPVTLDSTLGPRQLVPLGDPFRVRPELREAAPRTARGAGEGAREDGGGRARARARGGGSGGRRSEAEERRGHVRRCGRGGTRRPGL